jgi:hypothetical protein
MTESLFGMLANRYPNPSPSLDGATMEPFAGPSLVAAPAPRVPRRRLRLDEDPRRDPRGHLESSQPRSCWSRRPLASVLGRPSKQKHETLRVRAEKVFEVANAPRFRESWETYPFNSGYFMCVKVKQVPAEKVRVHLLEQHGIGLVAEGETDLRVAFSCLELAEIEPLFEALHRAIQELIP